MDNMKYFKKLFESISDYRKVVLLMFLIQNDKNLLKEIGFSKSDVNRLNLEFKNILLEEHEDYLDYIKDPEESVLEKFLNMLMKQYFNTTFEDVRYERGIILLLSLAEPDILGQSIFLYHEIEIIKNIALEKLCSQRNLKEIIALEFLEKQFSDQSMYLYKYLFF